MSLRELRQAGSKQWLKVGTKAFSASEKLLGKLPGHINTTKVLELATKLAPGQ